MSHPSTQALDRFRGRYPLRPPPPSEEAYEDIQLGVEDGFRLLTPAPARTVKFGIPPAFQCDDRSSNRYLWVIDDRGIPYIAEEPAPAIDKKLPKHTNLTGGRDAYLGGEMWFASEKIVFLSGASGRYPPLDGCQLEAAVGVFETFEYEVRSLGWDREGDSALRYWGDA